MAIYSEDNFFKYVMNSDIEQLILVDFEASWCPFPKEFRPKLDNLAEKYKDEVMLLLIETDK